ncbi:hypothetical protein SRABI96_03432 [Peribacillus sp. Bi96]|nr:hypothetical protein SRABI96_03432 [Peribacillus sp. Bi96]
MDQIQEISAITEQMAAGSQEIHASIEDFAGLTKETAEASKQVAHCDEASAIFCIPRVISSMTLDDSSLLCNCTSVAPATC